MDLNFELVRFFFLANSIFDSGIVCFNDNYKLRSTDFILFCFVLFFVEGKLLYSADCGWWKEQISDQWKTCSA